MTLLDAPPISSPEGEAELSRVYMGLLAKYERQETRLNVGYLAVPAEISQEEWIREQEELNKTRTRPTM